MKRALERPTVIASEAWRSTLPLQLRPTGDHGRLDGVASLAMTGAAVADSKANPSPATSACGAALASLSSHAYQVRNLTNDKSIISRYATAMPLTLHISPFLRWVTLCVVIDIVILTLSLKAIAALVQPDRDELYLLFEAVALALPPWILGGLMIPRLFGFPFSAKVTVLTICYVGATATLYPIVGFLSFLVVGPLVLETGFILSDVTDSMVFISFGIALVATPVGAAIGAVIGAFRALTFDVLPPIRLTTDALGGAVGGALSAPGVYLLWLDAPGAEYGDTMLRPILPSFPHILIVGVASFLPHLLLVGRDLTRALNPPLTTSASGAAPIAPSR